MKFKRHKSETGNGLVVTVSVVATILALLGSAVSYTVHISRLSQRTRRTALAVEIADGHLEFLFTSWRNIYRNTWTTTSSGGTDDSVVGTNFFFTDLYNPGPAPTPIPNMSPAATPSVIPLPAKSNFPTEANYAVTQYRIQAVDPMIDLDANENALMETSFGSGNFVALSPSVKPPAAYGPDSKQYSYFYLAAADVTVPAMTGNITAKVRRVFEKRFDNPWTYAVFYVDDLEFQPTVPLSIDGPIQTNGNLYIGTSNFTAYNRVGYGAEYVNGYSPVDGQHSGAPTAPAFPTNLPPSQESPYLPFGWNLNFNTSDNNLNNDSYHDLVERPDTSQPADALAAIRLYNQAGYRIFIDASNNITITDSAGTSIPASAYNEIVGAMTTNQVINDIREGGFVRLTTLDVAQAIDKLNKLSAWNGIVYISDTSAGTSVSTTFNGSSVTTSKRGIRLKNGATLPTGGLTIVAENPVYIQGDFNTGGSPPSNSGTFTSPTVSGYTRRYAAIVGDAINILSNAWNDSNSNSSPITQYKVASNTTINAALVGGIVPSGGGVNNNGYSGGGENFVRFLEDWNKNNATFTYYGSMVQLWKSLQGTGQWSGNGNVYKAPARHWYYDTNFGNGSPPGKLQLAAYLQQQRWYQVY
ncbi:MAG: hypothetical protein ABR514_06895 [Chthoniobacterales bacterium]